MSTIYHVKVLMQSFYSIHMFLKPALHLPNSGYFILATHLTHIEAEMRACAFFLLTTVRALSVVHVTEIERNSAIVRRVTNVRIARLHYLRDSK